MEKRIWEEKYSVGVKEIDAQHMNMIVFINDINEHLDSQVDIKYFDKFFDKLLTHTITHFETEEKYFDEFDYENKEEHVLEHKRIKGIVIELQKKYIDTPSISIIFETSNFLDNWLLNHIMTFDKKYTECFNRHGLH